MIKNLVKRHWLNFINRNQRQPTYGDVIDQILKDPPTQLYRDSLTSQLVKDRRAEQHLSRLQLMLKDMSVLR